MKRLGTLLFLLSALHLYAATPLKPLSLPMKQYLRGNLRGALVLFQREVPVSPDDPTPLFYLGNIYYDLGQYRLALSYYERALQFLPDDPELFIAIGNTFLKLGSPDSALFFYTQPSVRQALKKEAQEGALTLSIASLLKTLYDRGLSEIRRGRLAAGQRSLEQVLSWEPVSAANYTIALVQMHQGFLDAAKLRLDRALAEDPNNIQSLIALGRLQLEKGEFEDAIVTFQKVIPAEKSQWGLVPQEAFIGLGHAQLEQGKVELKEILPIYLQATSRDPQRAPVLHRLGLIALRTGLLDNAIVDFQKAIRANGLHMNSYLYMGVALYRKARAMEVKPSAAVAAVGQLTAPDLYQGAVFFLQRALQLYPFSSLAHLTLGQVFLQQGKPFLAALALRKAEALAPRSSDAHLYLGIALSRLHFSLYAVRELLTAVRLNSKSSLAHFSLAMAYRQLGLLDEAIGEFLFAYRLRPKEQSTLFALSSTYMVAGDTARARIFLQQALRLEPDYIQSLMEEARGLYQEGFFDSAIATYKRVLQADPGNAPALYALGFIYFVKGEKGKAASYLERGLAVNPGMPVSEVAGYLLEGIRQKRPI